MRTLQDLPGTVIRRKVRGNLLVSNGEIPHKPVRVEANGRNPMPQSPRLTLFQGGRKVIEPPPEFTAGSIEREIWSRPRSPFRPSTSAPRISSSWANTAGPPPWRSAHPKNWR